MPSNPEEDLFFSSFRIFLTLSSSTGLKLNFNSLFSYFFLSGSSGSQFGSVFIAFASSSPFFLKNATKASAMVWGSSVISNYSQLFPYLVLPSSSSTDFGHTRRVGWTSRFKQNSLGIHHRLYITSEPAFLFGLGYPITLLGSSPRPFLTALKHELWIHFTFSNFLPNGKKSQIQ